MEIELHSQVENIAYWNSRALTFQGQSKATFNDVYLREREIEQACTYLAKVEHPTVLDIGCGNGYGTLRYAMRFPQATFRGEDLSEEMIKFAQESLTQSPNPPPNLSFGIGDVTRLSHPDDSFDTVTTCRVLINVGSFERQLQALREIRRVLKPGGVYVLLESCKQSYEKLNALRHEFGLSPLAPHPVNIYIDEKMLRAWCQDLFLIEEVNPFSSTYYIGSRVAYPLVLGPGGTPQHDHPVNRLFAMLDNIGDYGREKIYLLRKPR